MNERIILDFFTNSTSFIMMIIIRANEVVICHSIYPNEKNRKRQFRAEASFQLSSDPNQSQSYQQFSYSPELFNYCDLQLQTNFIPEQSIYNMLYILLILKVTIIK